MRTKHQLMLIHKAEIRKTRLGMIVPILLLILLLAAFSGTQTIAQAEGRESGVIPDYHNPEPVKLANGETIYKIIIDGPPTPPPGYEAERAAVIPPEPDGRTATNTLSVPAYDWVFGCSSVSGAMIAGYYDRNGYPNMYAGPANGGVAPMDNSTTYWPNWTDGFGVTYPNLPLAGSHQGVDGRATRGSIDDYWVKSDSAAADPYITGGWTQHAWSDAIGDYMKTSQSAHSNIDGGTTFYLNYSATPLTCAQMVSSGSAVHDGTYGRKLFYEARGYTVTDCYTQQTDNQYAGGFSYAQFKAQIDAGRPVMVNIDGHTMVGVGYLDPSTIYINDTWDHSTHSMPWGGSYSGREMWGVSIVNITGGAPPPAGFYSTFNGSAVGWYPVKGAWSIYNSQFYYSGGLASKFASARHLTNYSNFTYEVRMKRTGESNWANNIILRGKPSAFDVNYLWRPSYAFQYSNNGQFSVFKITSTGTTVTLKGWTVSPRIAKNSWNTLKVVANGTSLKYYINGYLVWSGTDPTLATGQVGVGFYRDSTAGSLFVDLARLTPSSPDENPLSDFEIVDPGEEIPGGTIYSSP
jgi:hypothetical protein